MADLELKLDTLYRNRSGEIIKIVSALLDENEEAYLFLDEPGRWYLPTGRLIDNRDTPSDLIEEIPIRKFEEGYYWMRPKGQTYAPVIVLLTEVNGEKDQFCAFLVGESGGLRVTHLPSDGDTICHDDILDRVPDYISHS